MSAFPIHDIQPGCAMPPLQIMPVSCSDGSVAAAVWIGDRWWAGGPIEPVRWQEMTFRRLTLDSEEADQARVPVEPPVAS